MHRILILYVILGLKFDAHGALTQLTNQWLYKIYDTTYVNKDVVALLHNEGRFLEQSYIKLEETITEPWPMSEARHAAVVKSPERLERGIRLLQSLECQDYINPRQPMDLAIVYLHDKRASSIEQTTGILRTLVRAYQTYHVRRALFFWFRGYWGIEEDIARDLTHANYDDKSLPELSDSRVQAWLRLHGKPTTYRQVTELLLQHFRPAMPDIALQYQERNDDMVGFFRSYPEQGGVGIISPRDELAVNILITANEAREKKPALHIVGALGYTPGTNDASADPAGYYRQGMVNANNVLSRLRYFTDKYRSHSVL